VFLRYYWLDDAGLSVGIYQCRRDGTTQLHIPSLLFLSYHVDTVIYIYVVVHSVIDEEERRGDECVTIRRSHNLTTESCADDVILLIYATQDNSSLYDAHQETTYSVSRQPSHILTDPSVDAVQTRFKSPAHSTPESMRHGQQSGHFHQQGYHEVWNDSRVCTS
jgi:hypothetical protein